MSNGNPDSSGHACPDTFGEDTLTEDVLRTFSEDDNFQSISHDEDWFDDAIFNFDGAMASCEAQPDTLVDPPLESNGITLQSPPSTLTLDQQPCVEADFLRTSYNPATQDNVYGDNLYQQQSSGFSAFDSITFDYLNTNSVRNQYAVTLSSPSSNPSSKTRPDAAQVLETPVLKHRASPKSARAEPQQSLHRCESRITKAQFPFEQTTCGQTFARSKDLKRHKSTVHREDDDPVYFCRCGKDDPRKDNHARHVGVCIKPPCVSSYVCKCLHASEERDDHLEHLKSCSHGKGSRRRPNAS